MTYFFLYLVVVLKAITKSLMDKAYIWFTITWWGVGNRVGSQFRGVSLFKITWTNWGGKIGGPPLAATVWADRSGTRRPYESSDKPTKKTKYMNKEIENCTAKGQLISKAIYGLLTSPKNGRICFVCFFTLHGKQSNSSVRFLGESTTCQSAFWFYLTFRCTHRPGLH